MNINLIKYLDVLKKVIQDSKYQHFESLDEMMKAGRNLN
jgi:hypothetical protein